MPFAVYIVEDGPWLVIEFSGNVDEEQLVAARLEAAHLNEEGHLRDFILDFSATAAFDVTPEGVERIGRVDRARAEVIRSGRCAIVTRRELVELGTSLLAAVSWLDLEFRLFRSRADAEVWLRNELENPPPPLPRGRRR